MPKFKVVAEARYEYEVEADDDEFAIEKALRLFEEGDEGYVQYPSDVLEWTATETEDN